MLGKPETRVAPALGVLCEVKRVVERIGRCGAFDHGRKVQNGDVLAHEQN
jgi:hypothetical protein